MVSTSHPNAQFYFGRDVECIQRFFTKKFKLTFAGVPILEADVERKLDLDTEIKASGCFNTATAEQLAEYDRLNEEYLANNNVARQEQAAAEGDSDSDEEEEATGEAADEIEELKAEEDGTRHVTFDEAQIAQIEEGKRLIAEEIGSSDDEAEVGEEEEKKDPDGQDCSEETGSDADEDSEVDLEALEAERQAKKAKKLLPKKVKAAPKTTKPETGEELEVNMEYV